MISDYDFYNGRGSSCGIRQIFADGEDHKESVLQNVIANPMRCLKCLSNKKICVQQKPQLGYISGR